MAIIIIIIVIIWNNTRNSIDIAPVKINTYYY